MRPVLRAAVQAPKLQQLSAQIEMGVEIVVESITNYYFIPCVQSSTPRVVYTPAWGYRVENYPKGEGYPYPHGRRHAGEPRCWDRAVIFRIVFDTTHANTDHCGRQRQHAYMRQCFESGMTNEAVAVGTPPPLPRPVPRPRQTHRAIPPRISHPPSPPPSCGRHVGLHVLTLRAPCLLGARLRPHGGGEPIRVDA